MTIRNKTVYTLDTLYSFNKHYIKGKKALWITYAIITLFAFLEFALHAYTTFVYGDGKMNPVIIYLLAVVVVLDVFYILLYTVILKKQIKNSPQLNAVVECTFTEDSINENTVTSTTTQNTLSSYDAVYKVTQDEKFIYVFVAKNAACIIDKEGFIEGDLESLVSLLKSKLDPHKIRL